MRTAGGALALVVDDDHSCAATFARMLRRHALDVRIAEGVGNADSVVRDDEWGRVEAALIDVSLPDGHGAHVAALNVPLLRKPLHLADLDAWASTVARRSDARVLDRKVAVLARESGLTTRERDVLREAAANATEQKDIANTLGISLATVRSHVKSILRKTHSLTLRDLVRRVNR